VRIDAGTLTAILAVITFIFAVVGVAGTWRGAKSTSALSQYRDTATAWEAKSHVQAVQISDLQADATAKDRRIAELEGKVTVLQEALTGRAAWEILEVKIAEALVIMAETRTEVRQVHEMLEGSGQ
jgi:TolA-binding protein